MILWLLFIGLAFGYLYTAIVTMSPVFPVTGQQLESWALYLKDGTQIPVASLFALALIGLAFYMRLNLDKARAGDTGSTSGGSA